MDNYKKRAALNHFVLSFIVIAILCIAVLVFWFRYPLFLMDGTWRGLMILGGVDLVIGPLLTLIIINGKKSVKERIVDFSLIGALQLFALIFGFSQIANQRIVAYVNVDSDFLPVTYSEVSDSSSLNSFHMFQGIAFATLPGESIRGLTKQEIAVRLSSSVNYERLSESNLVGTFVPEQYISNDIKQTYSSDVRYKLAIGKMSHGLVIFDQDLEIIDFVRFKRSKESLPN